MAYQTLYRKYRPKSFEFVFGQDTIVKTLKNVIKNNKLSHAYLFTGPRGTGKTSSAKLFAKTINCLNNQNGDACNECDSCKSFNNNSNPDIIEIDAASNNGVDEIREIKNKVSLVPSMSKYKVYIIDEVHMLSIGAFNALLKTLEEPPEYVIFILATTEPQKLPATVISRCQRFDFKSITKENMKKCLENIIKKEKISITDDALMEIIDNSKGGMRDAIGMLDQAFAFCDNEISINDIQELSGTISNSEIIDFLNSLKTEEYSRILEIIKKWSNDGKDFYLLTQKLIDFIRKGILYKKNVFFNENMDEKILQLFNNYNETELYLIIDNMLEILNKMQFNYQKELIFEIQVIKILDELNVSRETLYKKKPSKINENTKAKSSKTVDFKIESINDELNKIICELKDIRINNILKESSRNEINFIDELWQNLNDYLIEENYKKCAGILLESKPVAASKKGIIITLPTQTMLLEIEKNYDLSKKLINQILNNEYKIVYITSEHWKKIRPKYVELVKNCKLDIKDEKILISKINKIKTNNSVNEFNELIEMEEK